MPDGRWPANLVANSSASFWGFYFRWNNSWSLGCQKSANKPGEVERMILLLNYDLIGEAWDRVGCSGLDARQLQGAMQKWSCQAERLSSKRGWTAPDLSRSRLGSQSSTLGHCSDCFQPQRFQMSRSQSNFRAWNGFRILESIQPDETFRKCLQVVWLPALQNSCGSEGLSSGAGAAAHEDGLAGR